MSADYYIQGHLGGQTVELLGMAAREDVLRLVYQRHHTTIATTKSLPRNLTRSGP